MPRRKNAPKHLSEQVEIFKPDEARGAAFTDSDSVLAPARRCKGGVKALRKTRYHKKTRGLIISPAAFSRLCHDIQLGLSIEGIRWQRWALASLQEVAEVYLVAFFEICNLRTIQAGHVTIQGRDMALVRTEMGKLGAYPDQYSGDERSVEGSSRESVAQPTDFAKSVYAGQLGSLALRPVPT